MISDFLLKIMEYLFALFQYRKRRRKQRWELLFVPLFNDLTEVHKDYISTLTNATELFDQAKAIIEKNKTEKNVSRRRRNIEHSKRLLDDVRQQLKKDCHAIESIRVKIMSYRNMGKRNKLSKEEQALLDAVLAYLPMLSERKPTQSEVITGGHLIKRLKRRTTINDLYFEINETIVYHQELYEEICIYYGKLHLSVVT